MSKVIQIEGHSDDMAIWTIFEKNGKTEITSDEANLDRDDEVLLDLISPLLDEKLTVMVKYTYSGVYAIGVAPFEEGCELPDWNIEFKQKLNEKGYSPLLRITVPDDCTVSEKMFK